MGSESEEFNVIQFEKRLVSLKDSQDHVNACCKWCLENRDHHKKIVISWLNVLKRVKIEQRLTLFYLANDVIQYSKRRNYDFVDSWGTALQKATTLVRDDKVKHKIVRIFNIWQQRGVYNEEFISDLCGLISVVPSAPKSDEPHEFQASYVINKIKHCSKLEADTDTKLKILKEHNPKIQIETDTLCTSLKDRAHVDDVEKELETYVKHLEGYINALKSEIKCRITNISVLKQANVQLDKDKKDVKVVANAYKTFGSRVKAFQRKLDEHRASLSSPVPSPDVNAPSPSPDSDIDLPDDKSSSGGSFKASSQFPANYYNPVPPPSTQAVSTFVTNGYTSFIGSDFNIQAVLQPPPMPENYQQPGHNMPLLPPPMPPFAANDNGYSAPYNTSTPYDPASQVTSFDPTYRTGSYANADEYDGDQKADVWRGETNWGDPSTDTPESPPMFEKESYNRPVEYHDNVNVSGAADVDHRMLRHVATTSEPTRTGRVDIDHRNLISLTGSPGDNSSSNVQDTDAWSNQSDQDYRVHRPQSGGGDRDYRVPPFNFDQLKLPPPPPPPASSKLQKPSPRKAQDCNVDSIDMDLSEDEQVVDNSMGSLEPPPPLPDLPDDVDANSFLDDLDNDLNSHEFTANLADVPSHSSADNRPYGFPPPPLIVGQPPPPHHSHQWINPKGHFSGGFVRGGRHNGNDNRSFMSRGGNNRRKPHFGGNFRHMRGSRGQGRSTRSRGNVNNIIRGHYLGQGGF